MTTKFPFNWFKSVGTALTIMLNALSGGKPYQTFSARQWELQIEGRFNLHAFVDTLFEENHCLREYYKWSTARQAVDENNS